MRKLNFNIRLLFAFGILLVGSVVSESLLTEKRELPYISAMKESVELTREWFSVIEQLKDRKSIRSDTRSNVQYNFMIGDDWSPVTTTLGSLDAKETSTNPDFSALMVRLISESGIGKGDMVGVVLSGSFPSLAVATLAALQTLEIDAVVMSSVGASTYGANQPGATWIDMEKALRENGGLTLYSSLVSIGAGDDSGEGLSDEGLAIIRDAALAGEVDLYIPGSLNESIDRREDIFSEAGISLLINIGGNQAALGNCPHSLNIPNGLHFETRGCSDQDRGLIYRMNEKGVPFINMLDIKDLAGQYGIAISPGINYAESTALYHSESGNRLLIALVLLAGIAPLYLLRKDTLYKDGSRTTKQLK